MKIRFKTLDDPIWFRLVDACPDELNVEEFVGQCGGKLFSDGPFENVATGIEFPTESDLTWFMLKI